MFSSEHELWPTPRAFFYALDSEFKFTLDPCATKDNAKCKKFFTSEEDGLLQDWTKDKVFMNPPYGKQIGNWMQKALESSRGGALVVCLVPARTDTSWWHDYVEKKASEIRFLRGRLKFGGNKNSAPFPSVVIIYRPNDLSKILKRK